MCTMILRLLLTLPFAFHGAHPLAVRGAPPVPFHGANALQVASERELTTQHLTDTVWRLHHAGANSGAFFGPEGILLVDGGFLASGPELEAGIAKLYYEWRERTQGVPMPAPGSEYLPYRYLINTHSHGDHTQTNPFFALAGARVIAHPLARRRMAGDSSLPGPVARPPMEPEGLPSITVEDSLTLHFNGEEVRLISFPLAHSDCDLIVWLPGSKVAFLGDIYWSRSFPFIELAVGARPVHLIAALERLLELLPADTLLVPGHGPATGMEGLRAFADMVRDCDRQMRRVVLEGKSLTAVDNMKMFSEYEAEWSSGEPGRVHGFSRILWFCYTEVDPLVPPGEREKQRETGK